MKNCIFSIIMPCYNSQAYVVKAIESVINQSYPHWELVIINDGSKDDTLSIVNEYAKKDKRILVFSKENGGYATAVNLGLDKISGDYFLFFGSDDYLSVNLLESLHNQIKELDITPDLIAFRTRKVIDGIVKNIDKFTDFDSVCLTKSSIKDFIDNNPQYAAIFSVRDTSKCFKRELLGDTRYFGKTGMDADGIFSMLICHKARTFLNVPVDGYYWTIRSDSVSGSFSLDKLVDRISNWFNYFEIISNRYNGEITETEKKYVVFYIQHIIKLSSNPRRAIKYRKFILNNVRFAKKVAKKFNIKLFWHINILANCPLLFSIMCIPLKLMKRILTKIRLLSQRRK